MPYLVNLAAEKFGQVDILINNAGIIQVGPVETLTLRDIEEAMATNFWGAVYCTMAAIPHMRRQRFGRIGNVISIGGKVPTPHLVAYSASKFALTGFTESLRAELAKDGILVTGVYPHIMRTGGHVHALIKGDHETEYSLVGARRHAPVHLDIGRDGGPSTVAGRLRRRRRGDRRLAGGRRREGPRPLPQLDRRGPGAPQPRAAARGGESGGRTRRGHPRPAARVPQPADPPVRAARCRGVWHPRRRASRPGERPSNRQPLALRRRCGQNGRSDAPVPGRRRDGRSVAAGRGRKLPTIGSEPPNVDRP